MNKDSMDIVILCSNSSSEYVIYNNGINCLKCNVDHFMSFNRECKLNTSVIGCSTEVDSYIERCLW